MSTFTRNPVLTMLFLIATIVAGYLGFRYFYGVSGDFPFTQELLLVFIGAVATVLITALLLNQQTELELRKEGQVLLLDQRAATYTALVEHIGEIVEKGAMSPELLAELRVLNHRLAMIGGLGVIRQMGRLLDVLDKAAADGRIGDGERASISREVAILSYHMRHDLLGRIEGEDTAYVLELIKANSAEIED